MMPIDHLVTNFVVLLSLELGISSSFRNITSRHRRLSPLMTFLHHHHSSSHSPPSSSSSSISYNKDRTKR